MTFLRKLFRKEEQDGKSLADEMTEEEKEVFRQQREVEEKLEFFGKEGNGEELTPSSEGLFERAFGFATPEEAKRKGVGFLVKCITIAGYAFAALTGGIIIDKILNTHAMAADTHLSLSGAYHQDSLTGDGISGARLELSHDSGLLLRADQIFADDDTTKWGVVLPYKKGGITANIELFGINSKLQNGLGTRLAVGPEKYKIGGIVQSLKTADGESQLFGPQFFMNLGDFTLQEGIYRLNDSAKDLEDVISNGAVDFKLGRNLFAGMWNVSENSALIGAGAALLPKEKGKGFGYQAVAEYNAELETDFESLRLLWGSNFGRKWLVNGFGITNSGDSEAAIFPVEIDYQLDVAGLDIWFLPVMASKAGFRIKHNGDPQNKSDTLITEAVVFPFNVYNGPKALKKLFAGGFWTNTRVMGKNNEYLTGAVGYNNKWLTVYMQMDEGKNPAGYITITKEF